MTTLPHTEVDSIILSAIETLKIAVMNSKTELLVQLDELEKGYPLQF